MLSAQDLTELAELDLTREQLKAIFKILGRTQAIEEEKKARHRAAQAKYRNKNKKGDITGRSPKITKRVKQTNGALSYHADFVLLWSEYPVPPNSSKKDAFASWLRLPDEDRNKCLDGAMSYADWLKGERLKRPDYPAKHLSTFINSRAFDTLLEIRA